MKVFASTLFLFLLAGCSPEELSMKDSADTSNHYRKMRTQEPFNPANANDHVGVVYGELLDAYYLLPPANLNLQQIIDQGEVLSALNSGFLSLSGHLPYDPLDVQDVQPYLMVDEDAFEDVLSPLYSETAVTYLYGISTSLASLKNSNLPYKDVYSYLVSIESAISADPQLTIQERDALLTTASIVRHSLHNDKKRKRRDRDWEWMTSNFAATANAAMDSQQQAVMMSFATDVYFD